MRTLTDRGEKTTILAVKALFDCTHSYTVMPILFKNGKFFSKILICFQDKDGKFGTIVESRIRSRSNIELTCSTSGKLTKSHMKACFLAKCRKYS